MTNKSIYDAFQRMWSHILLKLNSKADFDHSHDDRYYTESEINSKLSSKADTNHTHDIGNITNLQSSLDTKADSDHMHDDRYYTESEVDSKLGEKANQTDLDTHIDTINKGILYNASGSDIVITDSSDAGFVKFKTFGKSEQEKTSGNQLLPNGLSLISDGNYITSGENTLPAGSYTFSAKKNNSTSFYYWIDVNGSSVVENTTSTNKFSITFTLTAESKVQMSGRYNPTAPINLSDFTEAMLNKGSEVLPYEPYTNGPSPNPEYEQPIVSAGQMLARGKNLLENTAVSQTKNGGTFTVNADGSVTVNGTFSENTSLVLNDNIPTLKKGENYILSGCPSGGAGHTYVLSFAQYKSDGTHISDLQDVGTGKSISLSDDCAISKMFIWIASGQTFNNVVFKPMIRKAEITDGTYEPYTAGVKKAVDVGIQKKLIGKNQIDVNATMGGLLDHATGVVVSNGAWLTTEFIEVADNIVTMSVNNVSDNFIVRFCEYDSKKMFLRTVGNPVGVDGNASKTIELLSNTKYVRVTFGFNNRTVSQESYIASGNVIQLEYGTEATEIEPYTEQNLTINRVLRGIPVTDASLANYTDENGQMWCADYGDVERKVWVQRIGKSVFNGNDVTWYSNAAWETDNTMAFYTTPPNVYSNPAIAKYLDTTFCSHFIHKNVGFGSIDEECFRIANTIMYIRVQKDRLSSADVNGLKAYLSTIALIEVNYILATPIETPMTDEEIAAFEALHTNKSTTIITNDAGCFMEVEYVADTKTGEDIVKMINSSLYHNHDDRYYTESEVDSKLAGKADSGHTHNYAGSSSAGGAATSANKVNSSLTVKLNDGSTEGTNLFTFNGSAAKTVNITPASIGAVDKNGVANILKRPTSNGYLKFAEIELDNDYGNKYVTLFISTDYNSGGKFIGNGIVFINIRGNGTSAPSVPNFFWLVRYDSTIETLYYAINNHKIEFYREAVSGEYSQVSFKILNIGNFEMAFNWDFKLINTTHDEGTPLNTPIGTLNKISAGGRVLAADRADKVGTSNVGSATQPVYINGGTPTATTYTLGKSVPSDAKFTDTVYTHPTTSGNKHIPSGGSSGQILRWSADGTAAWGNDNNTTYGVATSSALGLVKSGTDITVDANGNVSVNDSSHNHNASNINAGTLSSDRLPTVPVAKGGTGATTAAGAKTNLGFLTSSDFTVSNGVLTLNFL